MGVGGKMNEKKLFIGPRIRRIRNEHGLTQAAMAVELGISPSYLNLIERNQRPLTVPLLLKLASKYKADLNALQAEDSTTITSLKEVFSDPLLSDELPGDQELIEISDAAPNAATGIVKLYRAYQEQLQRLSDLSSLLSQEGKETSLASARLPFDEVQDVMARRSNYYPKLEAEADSFRRLLNVKDNLSDALKSWLLQEHRISVRTLPVETMPDWRRRYDRHSQRLFISERLSPYDQLQEIAIETVLLRMQVMLAAEVEGLKLSSSEARRIARFELARYAAHALMMPYQHFSETARRMRYDIEALSSRFDVSFHQAALRLTTLGQGSSETVPFFLIEVDHAGNRIRRLGAEGFPQTRFGGQCPKLPVYAAFSVPGKILVEAIETVKSAQYLTIARTVDGPRVAFNESPRRSAILLCCAMEYRERVIYAQALKSMPPLAAGLSCRLCERQGCLSRVEPPLTRPLGLDEMVTGLTAFDFR